MFEYLTVIIPHYSETEQQLYPTFSSIAVQLGIDFNLLEVILVHDGGAVEISDEFFGSFPHLRIKEIRLDENRGPGIARQAGIGAAKGQYLTFIDAGDMLHNVGVIDTLAQEAKKTNADIVASKWLEECKLTNGKRVYVAHDHENTWMHGKLFRRQTLLKGNVRHHHRLRVHEDSYFLSVLESEAKSRVDVDIISYVWTYNANSITRRNGAIYTYSSMPTYMYAMCESYTQVERRNPGLMENAVIRLVMYCYFVVHKPDWQNEEHNKFAAQTEKSLAENILPYWHYWENADADKIAEAYSAARAKHFNGCLEQETLNEWLRRIGLETAQP